MTWTCLLCGTADDVIEDLCAACRILINLPRMRRHGVWRPLATVTVQGELL